ncbi:MAG: hypothetical protein QF483_05250 [Gammaproteobacteria bacterium]|jgi:hypothetical protein|nr:hypothetical protein [Gammaproteobacteria bacterium]
MDPNINFKLKLYKPTRTALSWFALFAFGMGAYAYWKEIGDISQVIQAVSFGLMGLLLRLTVFRQPNVTPTQPEEEERTDGDS